MNKEQYVTFEVAQILKEKGFDWDCARYYNAQHGEARIVGDTFICNWNDESLMERLMMSGAYSIPTQQMACRWLREERGIHIYPIPVTGFNYVVSVYVEKGNKTYDRILSRNGRNAYEEATNAALQYCLTNLI